MIYRLLTAFTVHINCLYLHTLSLDHSRHFPLESPFTPILRSLYSNLPCHRLSTRPGWSISVRHSLQGSDRSKDEHVNQARPQTVLFMVHPVAKLVVAAFATGQSTCASEATKGKQSRR